MVHAIQKFGELDKHDVQIRNLEKHLLNKKYQCSNHLHTQIWCKQSKIKCLGHCGFRCSL